MDVIICPKIQRYFLVNAALTVYLVWLLLTSRPVHKYKKIRLVLLQSMLKCCYAK